MPLPPRTPTWPLTEPSPVSRPSDAFRYRPDRSSWNSPLLIILLLAGASSSSKQDSGSRAPGSAATPPCRAGPETCRLLAADSVRQAPDTTRARMSVSESGHVRFAALGRTRADQRRSIFHHAPWVRGLLSSWLETRGLLDSHQGCQYAGRCGSAGAGSAAAGGRVAGSGRARARPRVAGPGSGRAGRGARGQTAVCWSAAAARLRWRYLALLFSRKFHPSIAVACRSAP